MHFPDENKLYSQIVEHKCIRICNGGLYYLPNKISRSTQSVRDGNLELEDGSKKIA